MRKYLVVVLGFGALAATVLAQAPAGNPPGACPVAGTRTVCVPEPYVKKTTTWVYNSCSEPVCLCYIRGLFKKCGCAKDGHCESPYVRRYLVKKQRTCEQDALKCVPVQVPDNCPGASR